MATKIIHHVRSREKTTTPRSFTMPKPVRLSKLQMTDWTTAILTAILMAGSSLMIVNGRCSFSSTNSSASELLPMCVGGHLSVQSWLAVTGIEFALLYTVVLPRTATIAISKLFTHQLTNDGASLSSLLNSLPSAPFLVAIKHGKRKIMGIRVCLSILTVGLSISYKFSFVRVSMEGMNGGIHVKTQMTGSSPPNAVNHPPIASNLDDLIIGSWESVYYGHTPISNSSSSTQFLGPFEMVFGPRIGSDISQVNTVGNENFAKACFPFSYRRIRTSNDSYLSRMNPHPSDTPYARSVRFVTAPNERFVDVTWIDNTLYQLNGEMLDTSTDGSAGSVYRDVISFSVQYCIGYVSWSIHFTDVRIMFNPRDIGCVNDPFDFPSWNHSVGGSFTKKYIEANAVLNLTTWRHMDSSRYTHYEAEGWPDIGLAVLAPNRFFGLYNSDNALSLLLDTVELPDPLYAEQACVGAASSFWGEQWHFPATGPDRTFVEYDDDMPFLVFGLLYDNGTGTTSRGSDTRYPGSSSDLDTSATSNYRLACTMAESPRWHGEYFS